MALRFSFFKIPEHKKFEYAPRIWNPAKEEREERLRQIQKELGIVTNTSDGKPYIPNIKGSFRKEYDQNKKSKTLYSNKIRSFIILGSILLLGIIFFYIIQLFPYFFPPENQNNTEYIEQTEFYE